MYLTDEEKRILDGEKGEIAQRSMSFLVEYGEAAGAERLIDIDGTVDVHPLADWIPQYAVTLDEVRELVKKGERFKVPTFANKPVAPGFIIDGWEKCGLPKNSDPEYRRKNMEALQPYIDMGMIPIFSCNYYLVSSFLPTVGQHCAWVESSAIPWANAILGARTNFDGCFHTAYLGKVPAYDMHLDENRRATVLVKCETELKSDIDYDLFGWAVGEAVDLEVPALVGIGKPTTSQLVKMNSALNTGGQVRMYHVPGLTPEAPTVEAAFQGNYQREISITRADLRRVYDKLNYATKEDVDFVYLGCPHYNIYDICRAAKLLEGKKCKTLLWIMTNPSSYQVAERMGLRKIIEDAGGVLLSGSCPGALLETPPMKVMATDSAKQNYYLTGMFYPEKLDVWYGSMEECINAAITGKWSSDWR
ncbi:MAG: DUF521 domain-containing protein [Firmicutes bacterium]|nr:DUF521 domain-containing protein [Bacillota bacterium]